MSISSSFYSLFLWTDQKGTVRYPLNFPQASWMLHVNCQTRYYFQKRLSILSFDAWHWLCRRFLFSISNTQSRRLSSSHKLQYLTFLFSIDLNWRFVSCYVAHMKWTQRYGVVAIAITVVLVLVFVLQQKRKLCRVSAWIMQWCSFVHLSRTVRRRNTTDDWIVTKSY